MSEIIFNEHRDKIRMQIDTLCNAVVNSLTKGLEALHTMDGKLADEVVKGDVLINQMQLDIEDATIRFMATQQPVASNLREFVSIFKIARSLERIADYAGHIAKEGQRLADNPYSGSLEGLETIIRTGITMTKDSITAYLNNNIEFAYEVARRDNTVDIDYKKFIAEVLDKLICDPENADMYTRLISTANAVERFCDHTTNICEAVIFINTGTYVDLNEKIV